MEGLQAWEDEAHIIQGQAETWTQEREGTPHCCLQLEDWRIQRRQSRTLGGAHQHDERQWAQVGT